MSARPLVLVCDDETQILRALRVILRDAGYEALLASTGEEALDIAVRSPAAAIVDLVLPDIDGVEICRPLREWSELPIIVLSAVGEEDAKVRALAAGADDYVTKPFGPRELIARLEAVLRRSGGEPEDAVIQADGLSLDLSARIVRLDGQEIHLTRRRRGFGSTRGSPAAGLTGTRSGGCSRRSRSIGSSSPPATTDRTA